MVQWRKPLEIMKNILTIENKKFWYSFFSVSYPNGYDKELDMSVVDITGQLADLSWWDSFTGYYDGVFEENDGYREEPTSVEANIESSRKLLVEFHPGDILYYINNELLGCTGPSWKLQVIPYKEVESLWEREDGEVLFWLLLPLTRLDKEDLWETTEKISKKLSILFPEDICKNLARCIINQLI